MRMLRGIIAIIATGACFAMGSSCGSEDCLAMLQLTNFQTGNATALSQRGHVNEQEEHGKMTSKQSLSMSILREVRRSVAEDVRRSAAEKGFASLLAGSQKSEPRCSPGCMARKGKVVPAECPLGCLGPNFMDVHIALPLKKPIINYNVEDDGRGYHEGGKNIVEERLFSKGLPCVVFGIGIDDDSSFEEKMAKHGCATHAFDCTISPDSRAVKGKDFAFHNWCIGRRQAAARPYGRNIHDSQFMGLQQTMRELQVSHIDILKFDIEGFEWKLFEDEILSLPKMPTQLVFELHTEGADQGFVPPALVKGRGAQEVAKLFLKLYEKGYRVVSKEVNTGDHHCAEFVLLNVL